MKLIVVVNNRTDTFETCILSRELSVEEIQSIYDRMGHGQDRTVHISDIGDKPIPFLDIMEVLQDVVSSDIMYQHPLGGIAIKHKGEELK